MRNPRVFVVHIQVPFAQTQKDHDAAGIRIRSEISINDFDGEVCAALTGNQCTITDIRIIRQPKAPEPIL